MADQPASGRRRLGETHWYSAVSAEAALETYARENGYDDSAECRDDMEPEIVQLNDDESLEVHYEDEPPGQDLVEQTCRQWANEVDGFLASTIC